MLIYAAGHKALGLYAMWALRDEVMRICDPGRLPGDSRRRLRLEDLLGFRRNPTTRTPLFLELGARALDGHPTPATPFVPLATGASGVGLTSAVGLAMGARDYYGEASPRVHVLEGEGGLTPGRVAEVMAAAGTASLDNVILHIDWNQASIDSDHVCREGGVPGEYVQWDPAELAYLHDWNVIQVRDGLDFGQVVAAQRQAARLTSGQPTAIVYRTTKGWQYGIEGKSSHGAGHPLCSEGFFATAEPVLSEIGAKLPRCASGETRCGDGASAAEVEACLWDALKSVRSAMEKDRRTVAHLSDRLETSRQRLLARGRAPRPEAPATERLYEAARRDGAGVPPDLALSPGTTTTLRGQLGKSLAHLNRASGGAMMIGAADLLGSTSVEVGASDFPGAYYNARSNPGARRIAAGGICEDALSGLLSGMSSYGRHIGVGASYAAFIAALGHVPARLHAIGAQARRAVSDAPYDPFILVCAHAGLKTGEDGPTHADPQALQLLQGNFPQGTMVTLTPWEPQEIWPLLAAALAARPAIIAPFVTRPPEFVLDRDALGLAPASEAITGVYRLRAASGRPDGVIVLQESGAAYEFVTVALPRLLEEGLDVEVFYIASAELFDLLPDTERRRIYPEPLARKAFGITGFTMPTLHRWILSEAGRTASLHPFRRGHYPGSGKADQVLGEAGLDGNSQFRAARAYLRRGG